MQNIKTKDVIEFIGIEPAKTFFYNALMRDFSETETSRIAPYEADRCFFTIRELLDLLAYADFNKEYQIKKGLKRLNYSDKVYLFDTYMNTPDDFEAELVRICGDRYKFVFNWKIELLNTLREAKDFDLIIGKFTEAQAEMFY